MGGQDTMAMAAMTLRIEGLSTATMTMAKMNAGMVWKISVTRVMDRSSAPPK